MINQSFPNALINQANTKSLSWANYPPGNWYIVVLPSWPYCWLLKKIFFKEPKTMFLFLSADSGNLTRQTKLCHCRVRDTTPTTGTEIADRRLVFWSTQLRQHKKSRCSMNLYAGRASLFLHWRHTNQYINRSRVANLLSVCVQLSAGRDECCQRTPQNQNLIEKLSNLCCSKPVLSLLTLGHSEKPKAFRTFSKLQTSAPVRRYSACCLLVPKNMAATYKHTYTTKQCFSVK